MKMNWFQEYKKVKINEKIKEIKSHSDEFNRFVYTPFKNKIDIEKALSYSLPLFRLNDIFAKHQHL